jgi:hypothetical protein
VERFEEQLMIDFLWRLSLGGARKSLENFYGDGRYISVMMEIYFPIFHKFCVVIFWASSSPARKILD